MGRALVPQYPANGMKRHRHLLAIVSIAIVVVAGVLPGAAYVLSDALVPLGPMFGLVVFALVPAPADATLPAAPALSIPASRAPPAA
jgi:hypothetical protein